MRPDIQPGDTSEHRKWTVMVFMGADTIAGNASLIDLAEADLAEMQAIGSCDCLNIFVQVHRGLGVVPRRGRITNVIEGMPAGIDALDPVKPEEADPAGGHALERFIADSLFKANYRLEDAGNHHTMLVLWGHAYDFAIGRAHTANGIDPLDFAELSDVLKRLRGQYGTADSKLDILAFDACDLSMVEMACQLEPFAKYLLGSQIGIPLPGWPYDRVLDRLRRPHGTVMRPVELGAYIVRRFCESYAAESRTVSLTLLDLNRTQDLRDATEVLARTLVEAVADPVVRDRIARLFAQSQTAPGKPYVDVADLCSNLVRRSGDPFVAEAARGLGDFLLSPAPPLVGEGGTGKGQPFIVEHGRNSSETARLNGLNIYAPHVAPNRDSDAIRYRYHNFVFAQQTPWSDFVHMLARAS
jgi:hypothetical protein